MSSPLPLFPFEDLPYRQFNLRVNNPALPQRDNISSVHPSQTKHKRAFLIASLTREAVEELGKLITDTGWQLEEALLTLICKEDDYCTTTTTTILT